MDAYEELYWRPECLRPTRLPPTCLPICSVADTRTHGHMTWRGAHTLTQSHFHFHILFLPPLLSQLIFASGICYPRGTLVARHQKRSVEISLNPSPVCACVCGVHTSTHAVILHQHPGDPGRPATSWSFSAGLRQSGPWDSMLCGSLGEAPKAMLMQLLRLMAQLSSVFFDVHVARLSGDWIPSRSRIQAEPVTQPGLLKCGVVAALCSPCLQQFDCPCPLCSQNIVARLR